MFQSSCSSLQTANFSPIPISYRSLPYQHRGGCNGQTKRVIDTIGAALLIAILAIPMLLIAAAIRLDSPGPILFRQRRTGIGNVPFETLKFRTMQHRAGLHRAGRLGALRQTCRHDPRVTRVGAALRRTSLDELPQLFNVLRGEMSLVGPRPHAPGTCAGGKPFELVTPRYPARHEVRPGMTGLAQVRGLRGETESEEKLLQRVEADLEYIENWSLWLDLTILMRTAKTVFGTPNAY
jgi:lipopolysaccharide/colanic/teichoic acid biosynthesis glycosyltransferase